jgi:hypothetical protein
VLRRLVKHTSGYVWEGVSREDKLKRENVGGCILPPHPIKGKKGESQRAQALSLILGHHEVHCSVPLPPLYHDGLKFQKP